jgi:transposase-like protein
MTKQPRQPAQTKQESREEIDRLVKEALERRSVTVTKVDGRRDEKCGKCGAPNRVKIPVGQTRVEYKCKECGHQQRTM